MKMDHKDSERETDHCRLKGVFKCEGSVRDPAKGFRNRDVKRTLLAIISGALASEMNVLGETGQINLLKKALKHAWEDGLQKWDQAERAIRSDPKRTFKRTEQAFTWAVSLNFLTRRLITGGKELTGSFTCVGSGLLTCSSRDLVHAYHASLEVEKVDDQYFARGLPEMVVFLDDPLKKEEANILLLSHWREALKTQSMEQALCSMYNLIKEMDSRRVVSAITPFRRSRWDFLED